MVLLLSLYICVSVCMCVGVWCLWKCPVVGLTPHHNQGERGVDCLCFKIPQIAKSWVTTSLQAKQINDYRAKQNHPDGVIQFTALSSVLPYICQRCISWERDEQNCWGPPTLHQARTNHNDFSTGKHPLQLPSPQQRLCKRTWETLLHAKERNGLPVRFFFLFESQ